MNIKRVLEELEFIENFAAKDNYIAGSIHNHATNIKKFLIDQEEDIKNLLIVATDRMDAILKIEKKSTEESTIKVINDLKEKTKRKVVSLSDYFLEEDIIFLKELAHKRKIQEKDGCADPVFWMIYDTKNVYCEDGEYLEIYSDGEVMYSTFNNFNKEKLDEFKEYVITNYKINEWDLEEFKNIDDNDDLTDYFNSNDIEELSVARFNRERFISSTTGPFLTKSAAKRHIEENYYHYSKEVTTYGLVGWRNPEFEQLMKIIEKLDEDDTI